MRAILFGLVAMLVVAEASANEQAKVYNLQLPAPSVEVIWRALQDRPYHEVAPIIVDVQRQIAGQLDAGQKQKTLPPMPRGEEKKSE